MVPIYAAGEADGRLFIAMRYVEGSDLKELLREGPLAPERTIEVCGQVAEALDFAHERGLVHRDVKPSNVLLDAREHVYLADFGLTKRLTEPRRAEPGLFGTIDYIAPEQIRGEEVDGRADVYSLGCLVCECLTGEPPFRRCYRRGRSVRAPRGGAEGTDRPRECDPEGARQAARRQVRNVR